MKNFPDKIQMIIEGNEEKYFLESSDDYDGTIWLMTMMCPERSNPAADLISVLKIMPHNTELKVTFKRY